ncbi:MAG: tetratricopeptide repeat protein [Deltaproteobacteria bacterium]|jgi:tetratricopeptide (TPR) repeat protein|nr:tetratricopeptide repeat protein [Deltaproteobacteria bacterium]
MTQTDALARAEEAFKKDNLSEAETLLAEVLASDPDNLKALASLGAIHLRREDQVKAQEALTKILAIEPDNHEARKNLALSFLAGSAPEKAKEHLEKLLAVNQNDFQVWALRSRMEESLGDLAAAKESAVKALLINPEQPALKAWLDAQNQATPQPSPAPAPKVNISHLTFLCRPGEDEEIDLLGGFLERRLNVKKVASLKEDQYLAAINQGRGALWIEGFNPRSLQWLTRLESAARPVVLRLGVKDLAQDCASLPLGGVTGYLFESKALLDAFLSKGLKPKGGAKLAVAPRVLDFNRIKPKPAEKPNLSLAYLENWTEPGLVLEVFARAKKIDPKATLWARIRPDNVEVARWIDYAVTQRSMGGAVLFATPQLQVPDYFAGRTHLLALDRVTGGTEVSRALAYGLKPLIRDGLGAREIYPAEFIWSELEGVEPLLTAEGGEDPGQWVRTNVTVAHLNERLNSLF